MKPPTVEGSDYDSLELQGVSEDRSKTIYVAGDKLSEEAPSLPGQKPLLYGYDSASGLTRYLCILPGGTPSAKPCTAGGPARETPPPTTAWCGSSTRSRATRGKLFWSDEGGAIYLRLNPFGEGAECGEESAPCTVAVAGAGSSYWGATRGRLEGDLPDGRRAVRIRHGERDEHGNRRRSGGGGGDERRRDADLLRQQRRPRRGRGGRGGEQQPLPGRARGIAQLQVRRGAGGEGREAWRASAEKRNLGGRHGTIAARRPAPAPTASSWPSSPSPP